jgi:hypothetical protein
MLPRPTHGLCQLFVMPRPTACVVRRTFKLRSAWPQLLPSDQRSTHATDVTLGWGVGAFAGYVVPSVLHYGFGGEKHPAAADGTGLRFVPLLPQVRVWFGIDY